MAGKVGMPTRRLPGLRREREARGLSQRQLAVLSEVTQVNISRLENGQPATEPTTTKLARALHVRGAVLMRAEEPEAVLDFSDAGTAYMDRVEAGGVEEVEEDEERYFDQLGKLEAKPHGEDLLWSVEGYERDLAQGLAALARHDREEGAKEIRRVLRRMRERTDGLG